MTQSYRVPGRATEAAILLSLYAATATVYVLLAVTAAPILTGEEAAVSMRDVVFAVEQRTQATVWSTNFWAPVYYWVFGLLDPAFNLFSGRQAKALALALVAPLVYATLRYRLDARRSVAVVGALAAVLVPGVAMFAPVAVECGLEAVVGLAGLLAATARSRWWLLAPVLAGFSIGTYPAGIAWAVAIVAVVVVRHYREPVMYASLAMGAGVVLFPLLWWTAGPEAIVVGGGRDDGTGGNFALLWRLLAQSGESYYYFSTLPTFGTIVAPAVVAVAMVAALWVRRDIWPWLLVAAATLVLWLPGGNLPGSRRIIALAIVGAIAVAIVITVIRLPIVISAAVVLGPLVLGLVTGHRTIPPVDWPAPEGPTTTQALDRLDADLRTRNVTAAEVAARTGDSRPMALVWLLAERRGDTVGLPTPEEITSLHYRNAHA